MKIQIKKFDSTEQQLMKAALTIRSEVFIDEQGVDRALEYDGIDNTCVHYLLYGDNKPIATARWRETEHGIKLERFAVLREFRSTGMGQLVLKEVLADVAPLNKTIYLHAQLSAVPFYEKNDFVKVSDAFTEAGIIHFEMEYRKELRIKN